MDAIKNEVADIKVAFKFLEDDAGIAPRYQEVLKTYLAFDGNTSDAGQDLCKWSHNLKVFGWC